MGFFIMGRKKKLLDTARMEKLIKYIEEGNYVNTACRASGVSESAFYNWMGYGQKEFKVKERMEANGETYQANDKTIYMDFMEAVKSAEAKAETEAVGCIRKAMNDSWQAAMTYLERRDSNRWGRRDKNVNYNINQDANKPDLTVLSDEELEIMERIMAKAEEAGKQTHH